MCTVVSLRIYLGEEAEQWSELKCVFLQALVTPEKFQHILRVLNTNIDGRTKIMFGLTSIKVRL